MSFDYDQYKDGLTFYFEQNYQYKVLVSKLDRSTVFLYSVKNSFSVIKIAKKYTQEKDQEVEYLKNRIAKNRQTNKDDLKVLEIYLDPTSQNKSFDQGNIEVIISANEKYLKMELDRFFADARTIDFSKRPDVVEFESDSQQNKRAINELNDLTQVTSVEDAQQLVKSFNQRLNRNSYYVSSIILLFFIIVPLAAQIVFLVWGYGGVNSSVAKLATGGTNFHLTILGGEGWRVLTYGFAATTSNWLIGIVIIIALGFSMFQLLKISEFAMNKWKFSLAFLISYLLLGYFNSVLIVNDAAGGVLPIYGIVLGICALNFAGTKSVFASFAKTKLVVPVILVIIFPAFIGGSEYISTIAGVAIGGAVAYLFTYDYKNLNWRIALPIIILFLVILIPSIFLAIPMYVPGKNPNVLYTMLIYADRGILKVDKANEVIHKIGWTDIAIEKMSNNRWGFISLIN